MRSHLRKLFYVVHRSVELLKLTTPFGPGRNLSMEDYTVEPGGDISSLDTDTKQSRTITLRARGSVAKECGDVHRG